MHIKTEDVLESLADRQNLVNKSELERSSAAFNSGTRNSVAFDPEQPGAEPV